MTLVSIILFILAAIAYFRQKAKVNALEEAIFFDETPWNIGRPTE